MPRKLTDNPLGGAQAQLKSGVNEVKLLNFDRDKPLPFKWSEFEKHVDKVQGRKLDKTDNLAASNSDRGRVDGILKKLRILRANPQLNFMMQEHSSETPNLEKMALFIVPSTSNLGCLAEIPPDNTFFCWECRTIHSFQ